MTENKTRTAWDDVEDAWQLCDQVNNDEETYKDGNPPLAWAKVFSLSPLIDFERTQREGGGNPRSGSSSRLPTGSSSGRTPRSGSSSATVRSTSPTSPEQLSPRLRPAESGGAAAGNATAPGGRSR